MAILPQSTPTYNSNPIRIAIELSPVEVVELRLVEGQRFVSAVASVRVAGVLVHGVRVTRLGHRLSVRMPERRTPDGEWVPVVELVAPALMAAINDAVIESYRAAAIVGGLA